VAPAIVNNAGEDEMSDTHVGEARLSAEDRLEILELLARYCWAIDCDDGPAWAATFTPDGVFHSLLLNRSFSGRDELIGMIETLKQRRVEGHDRNVIHVPANVVLEPRDDGKVRLVAQLLGPRKDANDQADFAIGWYDDVVVRTPAGWRFELRRHRHLARSRPARKPPSVAFEVPARWNIKLSKARSQTAASAERANCVRR
jgi:SnoaL-like domain